MSNRTKIPVTVVTGFLGAGKTTLINHVLEKYRDTKFALVENEFGDVPIDARLIKGVDASQMFELKQGCICCTISDEYEQILKELAGRFPDVEHLLIETTGVADPAGVIQPFFRDDELKNIYEFAGTICLIDAPRYNESPEKEITVKQLAVADCILVNKSEALDAEPREKLRLQLQALNPFSAISFVNYANAEDIRLNGLLKKKRSAFDFVSLAASHAHIQSRTFSFSEPLPRAEFIRRLEYVLDVHKRNIYRAKGILVFNNEPFEYILQGVGGSFELSEGDFSNDTHESLIVIIGHRLDGVELGSF